MKNSIKMLFFLAVLFMSCEDEKTDVMCGVSPIYLEEDGAIISDPFRITAASINDTCLEVEVQAGGCNGESWEGTLFVFPLVAESYPPQVTVEICIEGSRIM